MILLLAGGFFVARHGMVRKNDLRAFLGSSLGVLGLVGLWAVGNYPSLIPALDRPELSLTLSNSSSSNLTLKVMLIISVVGVPLVLAYTAVVYRAFWGRLKGETEGSAY
jgi:cytochrome d ubiquinol oxidase subunit II